MTKDLTSGSPLKVILLFSLPLVLGNLFQQFYALADTIIVGRFCGVGALASVGATGSVKDGQLIPPATHAWRDGLRQRLLGTDANGRAPWLAALVMGDGSGLSRDDWQLLQATGTTHQDPSWQDPFR